MTDYPVVRLTDAPELGAVTLFDFNDGRTRTLADGWSLGAPDILGDADGAGLQYGLRQATLPIEVREGKRQAQALLSDLSRALRMHDRAWLHFQLDPESPPVWLHTYRSTPGPVDVTDVYLEREVGQWRLVTTLTADPFAVGELVQLGPFIVGNDPARSTPYIDLTDIRGDAPAPLMVYAASPSMASGILAIRSHGVPADMTWLAQAEDCLLGTDASNPGSGPDSTMSGSRANNFIRTTFGTTSLMTTRLTWPLNTLVTTPEKRRALRGTYRLLAAVRRGEAVEDVTMQATVDGYRPVVGDVVTVPQIAGRRLLVDLGLFSFGASVTRIFNGATDLPVKSQALFVAAAASSPVRLDFDLLMLLPADEGYVRWRSPDFGMVIGYGTVVDPETDAVYYITGNGPFADDVGMGADPARVVGGFPMLAPGEANRLFVFGGDADGSVPVGQSWAMTLAYRPQYVHFAGSD